MPALSSKDLKPQKSNKEHYSILSNCISYTLSLLLQCHEMVVTAPEIKYDSKIYKKVATGPACSMAQYFTTLRETKDDF